VFGAGSGSGGVGWFICQNKNVLDIPDVFAGLFLENLISRTFENTRCGIGECRFKVRKMAPDWFVQVAPPLNIFLILAITTLLGGVMRGFCGYGSGLLMAPVFNLLLPPTDVVVIILLLNLLTSLQMMPGILRHADWRLVLRLFVPALVGLPIGLYVLHSVDPLFIRRSVALLVVVVAALLLRGWYYRGRRGLPQDGLVGVSSGIMTAIGGIGGPPIILYLLSMQSLSASVIRAVCLAFFSLSQISVLLPMAIAGTATARQGLYVLMLLPVAVLANFIGSLLHRWAQGKNQLLFRRVSLAFLLATGLFTFVA
jgi:uncharacterized membrane protein YfcA